MDRPHVGKHGCWPEVWELLLFLAKQSCQASEHADSDFRAAFVIRQSMKTRGCFHCCYALHLERQQRHRDVILKQGAYCPKAIAYEGTQRIMCF
jgi:hypothetical protein